jgi:hypothetical protein
MLTKSKKQKGKWLEKLVAKKFKEITPYVYSRADSGSGKFHKEDVTLPDNLPFFIECKNQAEINIKQWWKETIDGCPAGKFPILIYKQNYQREPTVVTTFFNLLSYISRVKELPEDNSLQFLIHLNFTDFINLIKSKNES